MDLADLPVFNLSTVLKELGCLASERLHPSSAESFCDQASASGEFSSSLKQLCKQLADCLKEAGALLIRDPRCTAEDNDGFLDMLEHYFDQADELKKQEARPELHFQVGVTPEGNEIPRSAMDPEMQARIQEQPEEHRAHIPKGPDRKWRYMWRVGPRAINTRFKELNAEPVVPAGFPEWTTVMDGWGQKMITTVEVVALMAAIGFGLPKDAFTSLMYQGPHLLAPTGSNLAQYSNKGTIFAGYHYDFNFLTIHGRSRFPGLSIWLRDGRKVAVHVPAGCLLLQSGKQLEWLTGGECRAGMHEVVVTEQTVAAAEQAQREGRSLWRVSSTLFAHVASDATLQPLGHFANAPLAHNYPAMLAGDFAEAELAAINLKQKRVQAMAATCQSASSSGGCNGIAVMH